MKVKIKLAEGRFDDLDLLTESKMAQVLPFVANTLSKKTGKPKDMPAVQTAYDSLPEEIRTLSSSYLSYALFKSIHENASPDVLLRICNLHQNLVQRFKNRMKPEEVSITSDHVFQLPAAEFHDELTQLASMIRLEREKKGKKKASVIEADSIEFFRNDEAVIHDIKTRDQAVKCGAGTRWCIAAEGNTMFSQYSAGGSQFVFLEFLDGSGKFAFVSINQFTQELAALCGLGSSGHETKDNIIVYDKDDTMMSTQMAMQVKPAISKYFPTIKNLLAQKTAGGLPEEFLRKYKDGMLAPSDESRNHFAGSPLTSYAYFLFVDGKNPHETTFNGVIHDPSIMGKYQRQIPIQDVFKNNWEYLLLKNEEAIKMINKTLSNPEKKFGEKTFEKLKKYMLWNLESLADAAQGNRIEVIKYFIETENRDVIGNEYDHRLREAFYAAAYNNNRQAIDVLMTHNEVKPLDKSGAVKGAAFRAVQTGDIDLLRDLVVNKKIPISQDIFEHILRYQDAKGIKNVVQFLIKHNAPKPDETIMHWIYTAHWIPSDVIYMIERYAYGSWDDEPVLSENNFSDWFPERKGETSWEESWDKYKEEP